MVQSSGSGLTELYKLYKFGLGPNLQKSSLCHPIGSNSYTGKLKMQISIEIINIRNIQTKRRKEPRLACKPRSGHNAVQYAGILTTVH